MNPPRLGLLQPLPELRGRLPLPSLLCWALALWAVRSSELIPTEARRETSGPAGLMAWPLPSHLSGGLQVRGIQGWGPSTSFVSLD